MRIERQCDTANANAANATATQSEINRRDANATATQNEIERRDADATATQNEIERRDAECDRHAKRNQKADADPLRERPLGPSLRLSPTNTSTATATFIAATPTSTPLTTYTCSVNERIYLQSLKSDIKAQALEMLDLDKHPALQGGRLAVRVWRSNPQCTHRVAKGENLFRLSLRYNTTVEALRRHNYLSSELVRAGQELAAGLPAADDGTWAYLDLLAGLGLHCAADRRMIYRPGTVVLTDTR